MLILEQSMIFLYLKQYPKTHDWQGLLIYRSCKLEQKRFGLYDLLLDSAKVTRIYLDELGDVEELPIGLALLRLIVEPTKTAPQKARKLVERVQKEPMAGVSAGETINSIATIMVYMFTHLSRKEVDKMIGLTTRFQDTKVYQEAKDEGREEGRAAERVEGIVSILTDRFGPMPMSLLDKLNAIVDAKILKELLLRSASTASLSDFEGLLK
jgi:predicted transposase YdaD